MPKSRSLLPERERVEGIELSLYIDGAIADGLLDAETMQAVIERFRGNSAEVFDTLNSFIIGSALVQMSRNERQGL